MEFNPYLPPRASVDGPSPVSARLGRLYRGVNNVYAAVLIVATALLITTGPIPLDRRTASVALYFGAPVACYFVLRWATPVAARRWLAGYGAYAVYLTGVFVWNMSSSNPDVGIGALILGINLIALLAALVQVSRFR